MRKIEWLTDPSATPKEAAMRWVRKIGNLICAMEENIPDAMKEIIKFSVAVVLLILFFLPEILFGFFGIRLFGAQSNVIHSEVAENESSGESSSESSTPDAPAVLTKQSKMQQLSGNTR